MSLTKGKMSEEVWQTCLTHALSTETEEIMGLLLGDIETSSNGDVTALIWGASPQTRSDRRKDRVETNPEQLAAASSQAESMTLLTGRTTRVIGWYHSHPHITVLPSHVDVRTQAMYQLLDSGFIGLIFSCFSEDAQKVGRIQVIAFQSLNGKQRNVSPIVQVINSSHSETRSMLSVCEGTLTEAHYQDTGDSGAVKGQGRGLELQQFFTHADASSSQKEKKREHSTTLAPHQYTDKTQSLASNEDSTDLSSGMQEAMYRSNMDVSGAEYVRKEIPLYVVPCQSLVKLAHPLSAFIKMQRVLFEEEQAAYQQAITQTMQDGKVHPLDVMHHSATYMSSMCKLIEYCLSPALNVMQKCHQEDEIRLAMLKEEAKLLEAELSRKGSESHLVSPLSPQKVARHEPRGGSSSGMKGLHPVYPEKKDLHPLPDSRSDAVKPVKDIKLYYSRSKGNRGAANMG